MADGCRDRPRGPHRQGYCVVAFPLVTPGFLVVTAVMRSWVVGFSGGFGDVDGAFDTVIPD
jgi:hypothetical protein